MVVVLVVLRAVVFGPSYFLAQQHRKNEVFLVELEITFLRTQGGHVSAQGRVGSFGNKSV
jgi:hypothetical protein